MAGTVVVSGRLEVMIVDALLVLLAILGGLAALDVAALAVGADTRDFADDRLRPGLG